MKTNSDGAKYKNAIQTLTANCPGLGVRALLRSNESHFRPKKVRSLAGTSPEYQRHVLQRAANGDSNPSRMIAATLLVYDTVAFREVTSRLHRAVGMIRKEAAYLTREVEQQTTPDRLGDRVLTLDLFADQAKRLRELLTKIETIDGTGGQKSKPGTSDAAMTDKLHAAGGLGLIAKNVRNVASLQPVHRPTPEQKELALRLTTEALRLAGTARDAARRAFGQADDACRVRPDRTPTRRVITHDKIDGDAVAAAWLAERFLFEGEPVEVLLVPRGRVWGAWRAGDCIVDVGNTRDPKRLFFDHKPPACENRHDSCAARLVWDHLVKLGRDVQHLKPLMNVVYAGDSARERAWFPDEYAESKRTGFHKALTDAKAVHGTDAEVYRVMRRWLDSRHKRTATRKG